MVCPKTLALLENAKDDPDYQKELSPLLRNLNHAGITSTAWHSTKYAREVHQPQQTYLATRYWVDAEAGLDT